MSLRSILPSFLAIACSLALISGCHKAASSTDGGKPGAPQEGQAGSAQQADAQPAGSNDNKKGETAEEDAHEGLHLKPEEVAKLGVTTEVVKSIMHAAEASGFGMVVAHETIAQSLADLRTAAAVARQSQSAFERGRRLAGTPGAMPVDTQEAAERQATVDKAALDLARQRLTSTFGQHAPWNGKDDSPVLIALASGQSKLVRVTFPMSVLTEGMPGLIRLGRIGVAVTAKSWQSSTVWNAPADSTVPGRSFFTIVKGEGFVEGERLLAWTPVGEPEDGVLIPAPAALISAGKYWCYVEEKPGSFVRTEIDPGMPVSGGYFVKTGIDAGDKVVVMAAGQLLAKELNPSTEAE